MAFANQFILAIGLLLLLSVLASRVTHRLGAPLLLVFLIIGMLAGEDGPGGIEYDNFLSANLLASLALAVILFDGGLRTRYGSFRTGLRPALSLATLGVAITAGLTGTAAAFIFGTSWADGLLIGAIVGSTDAAAVFYLLRAHGVHLNERVHSTLEIESGANDPMAVFLTLALIDFLAGRSQGLGLELIQDFAWQMGVGGLIGAAGGWLLARLINRLGLADSLYPVLTLAGGITIYGAAAVLEASGFLAAYLGGLIAGNGLRRSTHYIRQFHDGLAWLSQIALFLLLGLLVTPSELLSVLTGGLLTALVLVFVARPLAVFLCLWPFRFGLREKLFISWVGLRGAVPIVLGLYPLLGGLDYAATDFNIAFCVVLVSLVLQGWTVAPVARWLGIQLPPTAKGRRLAEFDLPDEKGREIVVYQVVEGSRAARLAPAQLPLPEGGRFFGLMRRGEIVPAGEAGRLEAGDQVYLIAGAEDQEALEELFGSLATGSARRQHEFFGEFVLPAESRLADLLEVYDYIEVPEETPRELSFAELFTRHYGRHVVVGDRLELGNLELVARQMAEGQVAQVGLKIPHR